MCGIHGTIVCHGACVKVILQFKRVRSLFLPHGCQGSNSTCHTWWQVPFTHCESSCHSLDQEIQCLSMHSTNISNSHQTAKSLTVLQSVCYWVPGWLKTVLATQKILLQGSAQSWATQPYSDIVIYSETVIW